jgi:DNA-binding PucR family transcriptional regulator
VALLLALGRAGGCATVDELGVYRSLFSRAGRGELDRFVRASIGSLQAEDRERSTELVVTLDAYLTHAGRHTAAAAALHIHPNTLYQRLAKIGDILGAGWRDPERRLELQIAVRLLGLAEHVAD